MFKWFVVIYLLKLLMSPTHQSSILDGHFGYQKTSAMGLAVEHVIKKFFLLHTKSLSLSVEVEKPVNRFYFDNLIYEISKTQQPLQLSITRNTGHLKRFDYYNLVMVDSNKSFRNLHPASESAHQDFSEFYLIVLHISNPDDYTLEAQNIFNYCWKHYILNVNILVQTSDSETQHNIEILTYYPFSSRHCHRAVMKKLNAEQSLMDLGSKQLYPDKLKQFYGCKFVAALWDVPPYLTLRKKQASLELGGMEGNLLQMVTKVLNVTLSYRTPPNDQQRGLILKNGSLTGAIRMLQERVADISLGSFRCTLERSTVLSPSITYYQTMQVFTILATRKPFTTFEILAYPFTFHVWVVITILLLSSVLILMLFQCLHKYWLKEHSRYNNATLVMVKLAATILQQPVQKQPTLNFTRYLFGLWLIFTFILRTGYQSLLYEFLSNQKALAPPETADELFQRGYTLIVNLATKDSISQVTVLRDSMFPMLVLNITDAGGFPILESNHDKLYATGTPRDFLVHYVNTAKKYEVFHVVREPIFSQQLCMYFTKHSFLRKPVNKILRNLQSFGLIDFLASKYFNDDFLKIKPKHPEDENTELPLQMGQLYGIFKIQLVLWGMAFVIFLYELRLAPKFKKKG